MRERFKQTTRKEQPAPNSTKSGPSNVKPADVFYTQLNALSTPRSVKTRRLAQAEDNPELTKAARLACVFRDIYNAVAGAKGMDNRSFSCNSTVEVIVMKSHCQVDMCYAVSNMVEFF